MLRLGKACLYGPGLFSFQKMFFPNLLPQRWNYPIILSVTEIRRDQWFPICLACAPLKPLFFFSAVYLLFFLVQ